MKFLILRLVVLCTLTFAATSVLAQKETKAPLRVLVDASKCGGLWWAPQGANGFDPTQPHQGKALADFMRFKGWQVTELPRGAVITSELLRDADIIIRPPSYFPYTPQEIDAYYQSVAAGARLLLIGNGGSDDQVTQIFGIRFQPQTIYASVRRWIPHPFTANIESANVPWCPITELPPGAVVLAWLNQRETTPRPVVGYLTYGRGYLVFMSQPLIALGSSSAFTTSLINSMARFTPDQIRQIPIATPVLGTDLKGTAPALVTPVAGAVLPQPATAEWRFDWDDVPGAKSYELVVLGPSAMFPLIRAVTVESEYVAPIKEGYIWEGNLEGWSWRVRANHGGAASGPWSPVRRFNVSPRARQQ